MGGALSHRRSRSHRRAQPRRPLHSPQRTASAGEERVVAMRLRYPDWGARKLRCVLGKEGLDLPASTIHRILLRHDLVREEDRHQSAVRRFERAAPNELWQMDFKGPKGWHLPVGPLSVLDDHSRYVIALAALGTTQSRPGTRVSGTSLCGLRGSAGGAEGSRRAVVELGRAAGGHHRTGAVVDDTRHTPALQRHRTSADPGQGRALSWRSPTRPDAARPGRPAAAAMAGQLPLGA